MKPIWQNLIALSLVVLLKSGELAAAPLS